MADINFHNSWAAADGHWLFAYGSLIWEPDFVPVESQAARLPDWRRGFFVRDFDMRTPSGEHGLALALLPEPGAVTDGLALAVAPADMPAVLAMLRDREGQPEAPIYHEAMLPIDLADGRRLQALAFIADTASPFFVGDTLPLADTARLIATARADWGSNLDYCARTVDALAALGCPDPALAALLDLARRHVDYVK